MKFQRPERLREGDTVAVVSPSWGGPSVFPKIYESGLKTLEGLGLKVKEYPSAKADAAYLSKNPKFRANDINLAFADKEVKAIFATIGGDDSVRILQYLNPTVIKNNPKILMGYSDTTTLLTYCNQLGLVTFHGPSVMAGLSQANSLPISFRKHIKDLLFVPSKSYDYKPYSQWSEGYPDWGKQKNVGKINAPQQNKSGWNLLQGKGVVKGELFGGCIEVLEFMKGTSYWPKPNFWKGKILFFETSEDKPSPDQVKWMLRNYGVQGAYDSIDGILFGRPMKYSKDEKKELEKNIVSIVSNEFGRSDLPIMSNVDFGHTDPQLVLPLGVKAEINCKSKSFRLIESALK